MIYRVAMHFDRPEAADALLERQDFEPQRTEPDPLIVSIRVEADNEQAAQTEALTMARGVVGLEPTLVSVSSAQIAE